MAPMRHGGYGYVDISVLYFNFITTDRDAGGKPATALIPKRYK